MPHALLESDQVLLLVLRCSRAHTKCHPTGQDGQGHREIAFRFHTVVLCFRLKRLSLVIAFMPQATATGGSVGILKPAGNLPGSGAVTEVLQQIRA